MKSIHVESFTNFNNYIMVQKTEIVSHKGFKDPKKTIVISLVTLAPYHPDFVLGFSFDKKFHLI